MDGRQRVVDDQENAPSPLVGALRALEVAGVRHCVWKGSDHLPASLAGERDLDLLIDADAVAEAERALAAAGLARTPLVDRDWVVDHLGIAPGSGRLLQMQVYTRLVIDDGLLGCWELPWADDVLERRRLMDGIWVTDPAVEIVLLLIRAAASPRLGYGRSWALGRGATASLASRVELLATRTEPDEVAAVARDWLGGEVAAVVRGGVQEGLGPRRLHRLRVAIGSRLRTRRVRSATTHAASRAIELVRRASRRALRHLPERRWVRGRTAGQGGLVVAVVGADGSGKSSITRDLVATFAPKLDLLSLYMGSGDGPSSALRWPLVLAKQAVERAGLRPPTSSAGPGADRDRSPGMLKALWALVLAREKRDKLDRAARARAAGALVVCDRYPQDDVLGFNDGPLLHAWRESASTLRRALAAREARVYALAGRRPPDLVLHLDVSAKVAAARRPDHDTADLQRRIEAVAGLRFPGSRHGVVRIDADRDYQHVLTTARQLVLERL